MPSLRASAAVSTPGPPHVHHPHLATRVAAGGGGAVARPRARWDRTPLWWIAVLFAIGSSCFLLASLASLWSSVTRPGIGVTFFVGSIFFTGALRALRARTLDMMVLVAVAVGAPRARPATRARSPVPNLPERTATGVPRGSGI